MKGFIHSIESFATMEGYGIRYAVFLSGCNLRCAYCHNPDTWESGKGAALEPHELVAKAVRYKPYFKGGGGVTFSGGEPLVQQNFLLETIKLLKDEGINVAIDTSCGILNDTVKEIYSLSDHIIVDLKFSTNEDYIKYAKGGILSTVIASLDYLQSINKEVWVRTVIVPGINDNFQFVKEIYDIVKKYNNVSRHELKPFHTLGFSKYEKFNIVNPLAEFSALSESKLQELKDYYASLKSTS